MGSHADFDFTDASNEVMEKIEVEVSEWISWKHPGLKKR